MNEPFPTTGRPRRAKRALALAMFAGFPAAAQAELAEYEIDPEHVTVAFLVGHVGYASVLGQFLEVEGTFLFDEETAELRDVDVTVAADSVFSNHDARDEHLRGGDFLDAERHPAIRFTADEATRVSARRFEIDGTIEILGVARPLRLEATWNKSADYPFGQTYVLGASARAELERGAFGMDYGLEDDVVGNRVEIIIELEAQRR